MGKGYQLINKTDRSLLLSFKCNLSHLTLQNVNISVPLEISWQLGTGGHYTVYCHYTEQKRLNNAVLLISQNKHTEPVWYFMWWLETSHNVMLYSHLRQVLDFRVPKR